MAEYLTAAREQVTFTPEHLAKLAAARRKYFEERRKQAEALGLIDRKREAGTNG